jgi:hypothetical protein
MFRTKNVLNCACHGTHLDQRSRLQEGMGVASLRPYKNPPYGLSSTSTLERCSIPVMRVPLSLTLSLTQVGASTW